jgi:type III secretory pathway lipoprotein EscJ
MHHPDDASRRRGPRVTPAQVVGIGLVAVSLGWAFWLLRDRPISEEVELLPGTVLPSSELAIVEAAFDRAQLTGHRTEAGRVWVPRPRQSAYMRALVDAEALPREFGSSLRRALEQNSPWQSRTVQEEMLRVAVQEELAHVICSMPGIERAAVLYDVDRRPTGVRLAAAPEPTASVNVRTQAGIELEPARVQAIRVLVAASIAGLTAERVAVTDLRSGRVFAGPLTGDDDEIARVDPALARRLVYERHLATKLRQALAFVDGVVVDVTVGFAPPRAPRLPAAAPATGQRVADANSPAAIADIVALAEEAVVPLPEEPPAATDDEGFPSAVLVTLAIPDTDAVARDGQPAADAGASLTEERLREHVLSLLPPTTRADGRRVVMTRFPVAATRGGSPDLQPVRPASSAAAGPAPAADEAVSLEAAWRAVLAGRPADVPRDVWLGVIAVAAGLLGWLVLRPSVGGAKRPRGQRRHDQRIDWSAMDDSPAQPESPSVPAARRQVAA